jgi:hypothetical protein
MVLVIISFGATAIVPQAQMGAVAQRKGFAFN